MTVIDVPLVESRLQSAKSALDLFYLHQRNSKPNEDVSGMISIKMGEKGVEKGLVDPEVAKLYDQLAYLLFEDARWDEAIELFEKRLEIEKKVLQCDDEPEMADTYRKFAMVLNRQGKFEEAMKQHQKALTINLHAFGSEHSSTATTYHCTGNVFYDQGKDEKSMQKYQKALKIRMKTLGADHSSSAITYHGLEKSCTDQASATTQCNTIKRRLRSF
ncbi:unnamed protein product [Cylindrotheca closterium]|uniref:Kinesin light chain n=1 Tax=Cylindrotheca closterium TaxID=2856 RepID=A0AAD2CRX4_9STRA|nr:unnamed protein product [Cylindrotheca closterium]